MDLWSLIVAILPIVLLGLYIYHKDRDKEPSKLLFELFMCGVLSCFPTVIVGLIFDSFFPKLEMMNFIQLIIYVFVAIAFVEEFFKWIFLYRVSYNHKEFDSSYDMIVYATFVSLGFACFENILYVISYGSSVGLFRAISAVPGHVCYGILMGLYLGLAKLKEVEGNFSLAKRYKILSIFIPVLAHGIYDFLIFDGSVLFIILFFINIIFVDIYCIIKLKDISKNSVDFKHISKCCPSCGVVANSKYCPNCGQNLNR